MALGILLINDDGVNPLSDQTGIQCFRTGDLFFNTVGTKPEHFLFVNVFLCSVSISSALWFISLCTHYLAAPFNFKHSRLDQTYNSCYFKSKYISTLMEDLKIAESLYSLFVQWVLIPLYIIHKTRKNASRSLMSQQLSSQQQHP